MTTLQLGILQWLAAIMLLLVGIGLGRLFKCSKCIEDVQGEKIGRRDAEILRHGSSVMFRGVCAASGGSGEQSMRLGAINRNPLLFFQQGSENADYCEGSGRG